MRLLALSVLLCSTAAFAGLKEGYEALSKKDYVTAANDIVRWQNAATPKPNIESGGCMSSETGIRRTRRRASRGSARQRRKAMPTPNRSWGLSTRPAMA